MLKLLERRDVPDLATLCLAQTREDSRHSIEFVDTLEPGVDKSHKWVMMISTQFGCAVGCRMCDAGSLGFFGNLSAPEMIDQIQWIFKNNPNIDPAKHPKIKIHFARMGEPSLNPETLTALRELSKLYPYQGIIPSLSSIAPKSPLTEKFFNELIKIKNELFSQGRLQLQFSIHSTDPLERQKITPIKKWSLNEIAAYGERFVLPGDRKITLNFPLSDQQILNADLIADTFSNKRFLIKITPVNPTKTADIKGATFCWNETPLPISRIEKKLKKAGFEVILSPSLSEEIEAATSCGQLWSETFKNQTQWALENKTRDQLCYLNPQNIQAKSSSWMSTIHQSQRRRNILAGQKMGLLIIDMQNFFLDPRSPAYLAAAKTILPNVWRLVESFRRVQSPVFWTSHVENIHNSLMRDWWNHHIEAGNYWSQIARPLNPESEPIFEKSSYNALRNTALETILKAQKINHLVIAGIMTNLCVESTARDAFDRNLSTTVVADATAAMTEEFHVAALKNLALGFSMIEQTSTITQRLLPAKSPQRRLSEILR